MTAEEVIAKIVALEDPKGKAILMRHGAKEPIYGVQVNKLKTLIKPIKKDHTLSLALYASGISDAMYLAGLIADENKISKDELRRWAKEAYWFYLSEYAVPWVAAESPYGWELAQEWLASDDVHLQEVGWATLNSLAGYKADADLDLPAFSALLASLPSKIHKAEGRLKYVMNGFIIAVGSYVLPLKAEALAAAESIGNVEIHMGNTACKVPSAADQIHKMAAAGRAGKKRKTTKC